MGKIEKNNTLATLFKQKNYLDIIDIFIDEYSLNKSNYEVIFYYTHSLLNTNQTRLAKESFQVIIDRFPEKYQGYEGLYLIAEKENKLDIALSILSELLLKHPKNVGLHLKYALLIVKTKGFEESKKIFESFINQLDQSELILACYATQAQLAKDWELSNTLLEKLIGKYPLNHSYYYKYGKNLQKTHSASTMESYFKEIVDSNDFSYILIKGYVESLLLSKGWSSVLVAVEKVVENGTPPQVAEMLLLGKMAYINLKKYEVLEDIINDFLNTHKDFYFAWKVYALLPYLLYDGEVEKIKQAYERSKTVVEYFPNNLDAKIMLGTRCMDIYSFKEAEAIFGNLIRDYSDNFIVFRKWVLIPFYEKNYDVFKDRVDIYNKKFPRKVRDIQWHVSVSLLTCERKEEFLHNYLEQIESSFFKLITENPVDWLAFEKEKINQIFFKKNTISIQDIKNNLQSRIDYLLEPEVKNISSYIQNSLKNKTLVVCFSSMDGKRTAEHFNGKELKNLNEVISYSQGDFDYHGFAKGNKDYNFLLLKDLYNCWYQIHTQKYIELIEKIYLDGRYEKLVCIGTSAGGFGALMFGQLLKSHLVFAYGPQTLAWTTYSTLFNKACEMCVVPDNPHLFDIGQLQYDSNGFVPQVKISLCENNAIDKFALFNLDLNDSNLTVTEYAGDSHVMYQVIGKRKMFTEICQDIDSYVTCHEAITGNAITTYN